MAAARQFREWRVFFAKMENKEMQATNRRGFLKGAAFSDADLSALLDVKFEVARRRQRWLEAQITVGRP